MNLSMLIQRSVALLKQHEPESGYYGCFSGGKDSEVVKFLAGLAGVKATWQYSMTTIDPPELVKHIQNNHKDVIFRRPVHGNFFHRMVEKGVIPTRRMRWCCAEYKENTPQNETLILGVRVAESPRRKEQLHSCFIKEWNKNKPAILPIRLFSDADVWNLIRIEGIKYCGLYDEPGIKRLGCVGCPMQGKKRRLQEFSRWPRFENLWKLSFQRIWNNRAGTIGRNKKEWFGSREFKCWEDLWEWWLRQ